MSNNIVMLYYVLNCYMAQISKHLNSVNYISPTTQITLHKYS